VNDAGGDPTDLLRARKRARSSRDPSGDDRSGHPGQMS
jgi:hypothetical protein